jgi:hypothetical protein
VRGGEERELFSQLLQEEYLCAWRRGAGMEKEVRTLEQPLAWSSRMSWERWQYFREIVKVRVADDKDFGKIFCENYILRENYILQSYFSSLNTFMRRGKDPDLYL